MAGHERRRFPRRFVRRDGDGRMGHDALHLRISSVHIQEVAVGNDADDLLRLENDQMVDVVAPEELFGERYRRGRKNRADLLAHDVVNSHIDDVELHLAFQLPRVRPSHGRNIDDAAVRKHLAELWTARATYFLGIFSILYDNLHVFYRNIQ